MHPPGSLPRFILGGCSFDRSLDHHVHFRFQPNAGQRPLRIAHRHPGAAQASGLPDQMRLVHHGSSSWQSERGFAIRTQKSEIRLAHRRHGLLVREGESGLLHQRLTRSIHRSNVVKSGVGIAGSNTTGGFQCTLITPQERTPGTWRLFCGCNAHKQAGNSRAGINPTPLSFYHTPIGYCQS